MTTLIKPATLDPTISDVLATLTTKQNLSNKTLKTTKESVTITGTAAAGTFNFDVATQAILLYNTSSANFRINVRGNATTTLDSLLNVGESIGVCALIPNGATAYYLLGVNIDGVAQTIKLQNGNAISAGNTNSTDMYNVFIIKTAAATYQTFVSQTKYA